MGKKETVEVLVEGGKATAGPQIGGTLGPLKVNIGQVISVINDKTKDFKGMKVPVKVIVDTETKEFDIEIGTPPTSELIKKELDLKLGSGEPNKLYVGVASIEQIIKVAKMKRPSLFVNNLKSAVKTILGSCQSMGILVEGKKPHDVIVEVNEGVYDKEINAESTETPKAKLDSFKLIKVDLEKKIKEVQKKKEQEKAAAEAKAATPEAATSEAAKTAPAAKPAVKSGKK